MGIFKDNSRHNTDIRKSNIAILKKIGFTECGAFSRSGEMYMRILKYGKRKFVFGVKPNISRKYFSMVKYYGSEDKIPDFKNVLSIEIYPQICYTSREKLQSLLNKLPETPLSGVVAGNSKLTFNGPAAQWHIWSGNMNPEFSGNFTEVEAFLKEKIEHQMVFEEIRSESRCDEF